MVKRRKLIKKIRHNARWQSIWKTFSANTSRIIVLFSIITVLIFTSVCIFIQYKTNMDVSSTLIDNFYQFFGYEMLILGGIKVSKNIKDTIICKINDTIEKTNTETESEDFEE